MSHSRDGSHRVHTEWQRPLTGVHSIMMEKLAQADEGRGVYGAGPPPSLYLPSRTKLQCTLQLRGQIHSSYFTSTPYILCAVSIHLWGGGVELKMNLLICEGVHSDTLYHTYSL
jgi:hypothetical protein